MFSGIYVEFDQNPCILSGNAVVTPGTQLVKVLALSDGQPFGGYIRGDETGLFAARHLYVGKSLQVSGGASYFGPQASPGAPQDCEVQLRNWNEYSFLTFWRQGAYRGQILNGLGQFFYDVDLHNFRTLGAASIAQLSSAGFDLKQGAYKLNGAAVISAAGAVNATNGITTSGGPIGYASGAGNAVTQATSKGTAVTINKPCGQITTNAASLAAGALIAFTVNNSLVAPTDTVKISLAGGNATAGSYRHWVEGVSAGSFKVVVENRSGSALAEALLFNFALLKAVNA
jgi:hypothetical protein